MTNTPEQSPPADLNTDIPHSARIWNYWLGGKDNFEPDRAVGEMVKQTFPDIVTTARQVRAFLSRTVRYLAGEAGVRQFLDIGTGLPTVENTHEVAQRVAPESRIVYVDNDPLVLVHARALLTSTSEGTTEYIDADLREPDRIVQAAKKTLDFDRPIAVVLMGILAHIEDYEEARSIVRQIMDAVPSGSYLTISDGTDTSEAIVEAHHQANQSATVPYHLRSPEQIAGYFEGLELIDPGVVPVTEWRPDPDEGQPTRVDAYGGVARKP
ncbi:MAG TPA: SAM-dependent methyltransferase [Jiangellaceae bacterium]